MAYQCALNEASLKKAYEELNEKPEWRMRDIEAVRDLCLNTPGLNSCLDDAFLVRFLRARKFEYDGTVELICNYYKQRGQHPAIFENFKPSSIKHILDKGLISALGKLDEFGRQLILLRPGSWSPQFCSFRDLIKCVAICMEYLIEDENLQVNGFVFIVDSTNFSWHQLRAFYPSDVRAAFRILQDAFPSRTKEIHFIHEARALGMAFSVMSPLFKEKIRKRIHFHGSNFNSLHSCISPDLLPNDPLFRGTGPPLINQEFIDALMQHESEFERLLKFSIDLRVLRATPARSVEADTRNAEVGEESEFNEAVSNFEQAMKEEPSPASASASAGSLSKFSSLSMGNFQKKLNNCASWIPSSASSYRNWFSSFGRYGAAGNVQVGSAAADADSAAGTARAKAAGNLLHSASDTNLLPKTPNNSVVGLDSVVKEQLHAMSEEAQNA